MRSWESLAGGFVVGGFEVGGWSGWEPGQNGGREIGTEKCTISLTNDHAAFRDGRIHKKTVKQIDLVFNLQCHIAYLL